MIGSGTLINTAAAVAGGVLKCILVVENGNIATRRTMLLISVLVEL